MLAQNRIMGNGLRIKSNAPIFSAAVNLIYKDLFTCIVKYWMNSKFLIEVFFSVWDGLRLEVLSIPLFRSRRYHYG